MDILTTLRPSELQQLGYSNRQARRILSGEQTPHPRTLALLTALTGQLGIIHAEWDGWTLNRWNGHLVTPSGHYYTPQYLDTELHWIFERMRNERAEIRDHLREAQKNTPPQVDKMSTVPRLKLAGSR